VREERLGAADAASFWRHVKVCSECAAGVARDEQLRALGRSWHAEGPSPLEVRRLRAHVLRDVANAPVRRETPGRRALAVGLLAAAVAVPALAMVLRHPGRPVSGGAQEVAHASSTQGLAVPLQETSFAGAIVAARDVSWSRTREGDVERVYLTGGSLAVHVRPQKVGERFLVVLPDGELEVRGTTFQVAVADGATSYVHVDEGVVELRLRGNEDRRLGAGDSWRGTAPAVAAALPTPAAQAPAQQRLHAAAQGPAAPAQPPLPASGLDAYAEAMRLLQAGRAEDAATAFHAFAMAHPGAPQAEDASFLEALALARAGRRDAAGLAAERHLASYPRSFHAKEAAILVARAAASRGDCNRARAVLSPWSSSAGAEVESLLRGCDTVP
jgi:TolA-binding protein